MGNLCSSSPKTLQHQKSKKDFQSMATNDAQRVSNMVGKDQFVTYIAKRAELWAMLSVNLGLPEQKCIEVAVDVAFNMVSHKYVNDPSVKVRRQSIIAKHDTMSEDQFHKFTDIVSKPKGQLEFFHRTVFQAFDKDNNGVLDAGELDAFLETFYSADSIFKGDARLPSKEVLRSIVNERFDKDGDGELSFDEIHMIISGKADLSPITAEVKDVEVSVNVDDT